MSEGTGQEREEKGASAEESRGTGAGGDTPPPAASNGGKVNGPETPTSIHPSVYVDKAYPNVKPSEYLGGKLLAVVVIIAVLGAAAAYIRQHVCEWPPSPRVAAVPKRDLPAYYLVQPSDLKPQIGFAGKGEAAALKKVEDAAGRYTLEPLSKEKPIADAQLGPHVDGAQFPGKVVTEVEALTLPRENLGAGNVADLVLEWPAPQGQPSQNPQRTTLQNILVLKVQTPEKPEQPAQAAPDQPVKRKVFLALPADRHAEVTSEAAKKASLYLRKKSLTK
jgi:hypothetical protein